MSAVTTFNLCLLIKEESESNIRATVNHELYFALNPFDLELFSEIKKKRGKTTILAVAGGGGGSQNLLSNPERDI